MLRGLIALANAMCDNTSGATYDTTIVIPGHSTPPGTAGDGGSTYWFAKPNAEKVIIPLSCNWPIRFLGTGSTILAVTADSNTPVGEYGDFFEIQTGGSVGGVKLGDNTGGLTSMVGLKLRFHDVRHAFATLTMANGTPLKEVQSLMGHSTANTTLSFYARTMEGLGREAVNNLARSLSVS